ncbi:MULTISPECIES: transporter substrate-binding domain-containing protein [unclassified Streptococcus]|uniref:transporter substrate-binding domain-containing protein n=1 Tax=unclassified Streptococcus TaxID=2608887 RepID=UPI00155817EB|nr:transporter substrate-binding domain-containing protein [Streptococcus suis]
MLKKLLASAFLVSTLTLAACSSNASKTEEATAEPTKWEQVKEAGVLKVATPGTLFPTSYYNDKKELVGYEVDMMKEIGKRLDLEIEFQEIGVAEALTSVDSGKVDVSVNNLQPTAERKEKYNLSEAYKYSVSGMIVREDGSSNITAKDLSDWKGKKAGGGAGTTFMKIAEKQGAEPVIYDNVTNDVYLRDVSTGRTDFIPNDYFTQVVAVKMITAKFPDIKVKMGDVRYNPNESVIVMSKEDDSLKQELDKVIKEMKEDGSLKAISEKHYAGQDLTKPAEGADELPVVDVD